MLRALCAQAFALCLTKVVVSECLIIATEQMHLLSVPLGLDVEFCITTSPWKASAHSTGKDRQLKAPIHSIEYDNEFTTAEGTVVSTRTDEYQNEAGKVVLSSRAHYVEPSVDWSIDGDSDNEEEIYQSLIDYQEVKTLTMKGDSRQRLGNAHVEYASADAGCTSGTIGGGDRQMPVAQERKLQAARRNLKLTLAAGHTEKSPVVNYWRREITRLSEGAEIPIAAPRSERVKFVPTDAQEERPPVPRRASQNAGAFARPGSTAGPVPHMRSIKSRVQSARPTSPTEPQLAVCKGDLAEQKRRFLEQQRKVFTQEVRRAKAGEGPQAPPSSLPAAGLASRTAGKHSPQQRSGEINDPELQENQSTNDSSKDTSSGTTNGRVRGVYKEQSSFEKNVSTPNDTNLLTDSDANSPYAFAMCADYASLAPNADHDTGGLAVNSEGYASLRSSVSHAAMAAPQLPSAEEISQMSVEGVCSLLQTLGLPHLMPVFAENAVTGKFFLQLDDAMLADDLGVTRRFERLKIMQFQ